MKKIISLVIVILLLFSITVQVLATGVDEKKQDLNKVSDDIKDTKKDLEEVKKEQKDVHKQLDAIEKDLEGKEKELAAVETKLANTQAELEATKKELEKTEIELADTQAELEGIKVELQAAIEEAEQQEMLNADRLRAMYMNTNTSYLELLLEAKSLNDLLNRADMITQMISYDQQVFDDMLVYRDEVKEKKSVCEDKEFKIQQFKNEIENKKASLEKKEQDIIDTKAEIAKQKKQIESAQNEKEKLLSKLTKEEAAIRRELDELEKLSKKLEKEIQELIRKQQSSNPNYSGGVMAWPAPGFNYISSPFGRRYHPIAKTWHNHSGIDIAGAGINKTPAIAAADGTVIMAQWYGGYGNCVIIDHGGGITTLYGHGSAIKVKVGQKVKKGDTVLSIGSTGNSTGPHLHFEVRKNGAVTDPMVYLRK